MNKEKTPALSVAEGLIPELRFPEFKDEGEWIKNKLEYYLELLTDFEANGSFADVKNNVTIYEQINYAWYVRATDLENNNPIEKVKFVDQKSYDFLKKTALFGGELLITKRGEIGKVYFFNPDNSIPATVAPNLYLLKFNKLTFPKFFFYYFTTPNGNNSLKRLNASSTIGALYKDDVKNIIVLSPSLKEQKKIASCLSSLDEVIAAHTQKLELLKAHKKGLMQNLFPPPSASSGNGAKVPKYRFKEFEKDGEWVEKKLGDMTTKVGSGVTPLGGESNYKETGRPFVRSQNIGWGLLLLDGIAFIDEETHRSSINTEIELEDVLLNITGASIGRSAIANEFVIGGNVNQHVCIIRTQKEILNPFFLTQFLVSNFGQKQIDSFQAGGNREGLNFAQIRSFSIPTPPSPREQQKIAACLSSLDALIMAQTKKIEQLKLHKKGLMQRLFPKIND